MWFGYRQLVSDQNQMRMEQVWSLHYMIRCLTVTSQQLIVHHAVIWLWSKMDHSPNIKPQKKSSGLCAIIQYLKKPSLKCHLTMLKETSLKCHLQCKLETSLKCHLTMLKETSLKCYLTMPKETCFKCHLTRLKEKPVLKHVLSNRKKRLKWKLQMKDFFFFPNAPLLSYAI